ncbi:hypothetical protein [Devosia rhizoryzae]|uniref:Adenylate cyclase n=1 Tax=Devosia rhizoryzae TaxID=2774137 RepID=A0ABX7C9A4_9HYPH|nr:hypothetical protein [Devosia rhizoryzae]QQR39854.1 hypothetical protein JI748_02220 [Devosia rhizoryzae]
MSDGEPTDSEIAEALSRILAYPEMARSAQLGRFLQYIVERRQRGDVQAIKAYSIAVDVFGRPQNFDPQTDPIVRVQARRLRALLEQYYAGPGSGEAIRIELPTGRYVPEFVRLEPAPALPQSAQPPPAAQSWDFRTSWIALAVMTAVLATAALATSFFLQRQANIASNRNPVPPPVVSIMELQSLTGAVADVGVIAGLAVELVTDLEQFESLRVVYGERRADVKADYVLSGIVRREAGGLQFSAILTEAASDVVVWNKAVAVGPERLADPELLNSVSGTLSRTLGSPRGPLHRRARALLTEENAIDGRESLYLCRVLFDLYRERAYASSADKAQRCYAALPDVDQQAAQALAATASLEVEGLIEPTLETGESERLVLAGEALAEAVALSPVSGFVWEQRARYLEHIGDHAGAEAAYSSALQLNPANSDTLAARARHLALIGKLGDAEPLASLAINSAPNPPSWYLIVPALKALRDGKFSVASIYARGYAEADRELGPILTVMAAQGIGDQELVTSYLPRVLEVPSFRANGVLTQLRKRITDEGLIRDIRTALLGAGMPPAVLNSAF